MIREAAREPTRWPDARLLIWLAYVIVPIDAGGLIHGVPLGPVEVFALLIIAWLAMHRERIRGAAIAAAVLGVSVAASVAIPGTRGFQARYFANAGATGPHERGVGRPDSPFSRVDGRLDFAPGETEFPLAFFNDATRFNFYRPEQPDRRLLEFAASWSGFWWVAEGTYTIYVDAPQSSAQVFVDGARVVTVSPEAGQATREIALAGGWHRLNATFSSPYAAPHRFSAGTLRGDHRTPFDSTTVATQPVRPWHLTVRRALRLIKTGVDACALAWLSWLFVMSILHRIAAARQKASTSARLGQVRSIFIVVAAIEALAFAWRWSTQTMILPGGEDTITYEGYARDILFNGILMNRNAPLGQGEPFYYQAFYPYFLAAVHALFGEGMFGVMLVQRLLVAFTIWMVVDIAIELGGEDRWPAALGSATLFACWKFWPLAAKLTNESLYIPLLMAWTALLVRVSRDPTAANAAGAGVLGGFTALTRSTALLAWVAVFPGCWTAWRHAARRHVLVGLLVVCSFGVFSLIAARNWIVAGRFVPMPTELGVTLLGANELPAGLAIDLSARGALYRRLGLEPTTAQVVEYAVRAPGPFAANLGRKALFVLGFFESYAPGWGYSPVYIAVWVAACAGLVLALRAGRAPIIPLMLPALIAVSQFAALVVVYPKGERLILPVHMLLMPYAAVAASCLVRAFLPADRRMA